MAGLGMENDQIPNSAITASSVYSSYRADQGRLYNQGGSRGSGTWLAGTNNLEQWFQVELGDWTKITRVCTQGRLNGANWVTKYKLVYGYDAVFYKEYKEEGDDAKVRVYCTELNVSERKLRHKRESIFYFLGDQVVLTIFFTFADCVTNIRPSQDFTPRQV